MRRNQQNSYIPQLFKYVQIVMATNKNAVQYATVGTEKKYWSVWKEEDTSFLECAKAKWITGRTATVQDENIISLFSLQRLNEITKYFVLYDANVKKICRYQQYFAVKEIIKTINMDDTRGNRQSGVVWHTQGSGKSLTMVMLAKYILLEMAHDEPKVVIVTDRKELDKQIAKTFTHTKCKPARATSGKNLLELIDKGKADIITTIINKFEKVESSGLKNMSRNIFVYTIRDGVADKAIVPLIYEGRFVEQSVDEENIDLWFEQTTKRLTDSQKRDLKRKWSCMKRLSSTQARIRRIALDINNHFMDGYKNTGFKAMLATNRKRDAVSYLACFEQLGDLSCEVCISAPDLREGVEEIDDETDNRVLTYWNKMMKRYGDADSYEDSVKTRFVDGDIDILIVCSKLLTGFDAPRCQVLYIDKELKEHGLLQAIARTNRLYEGKEYGLIVDYRGLIQKLDDAMNMYMGAGLENFADSDLKGTMTDIIGVVGSIRQSYSRLTELFYPVNNKSDVNETEQFLADEKVREEFYKLLCMFGRDLAVVLNSVELYETIPREERVKYQNAFVFYSKVRRSVKICYCDAIDNKVFEPIMQNLLDTHLSVAGLKQITEPVDIMNQAEVEKELETLGSVRAKADAVQSKLAKSISQRHDENPAYYDSFSNRIKETLQQYKEQIITEAQRYEKLRAIMQDYVSGVFNSVYPGKLKNNVHAQAFYDNICPILEGEWDTAVAAVSQSAIVADGDTYGGKQIAGSSFVMGDDIKPSKEVDKQDTLADIAIGITKIIDKHSRVDWTNNTSIHGKIATDIDNLFYDYERAGTCNFSYDTIDKVIENVILIAIRRYKG